MDLVILDNEPVSVLLKGGNKTPRVMAYFDATFVARRKKSANRQFVVPTTVRVEAHWDRS